jgi:hypothetical protein
MATTYDRESYLGKSATGAVNISEDENIGPGLIFQRRWRRFLIARTATTLAVMLIFALPLGLAFSSKNYILATLPLLKQLGIRLPSNKSAVLAVDVDGLTIQSRSSPADSVENFERSTMEQLANLHRTYTAWSESHEDLSGSLLVKLRVDKSGRVTQLDPLAVRLSNAIFTQVVLSEIRRWSFPAGGAEPVEITMPLLFIPRGMDPNTVVHWERRTRVVDRDGTISIGSSGKASVISASASGALPALRVPSDPDRHRGIQPLSSISASKPEPKSEIRAAFKTTQAIGLRDQPRYSAKRFHEIDADTELNLLEHQGDWLKVQVADTALVGFVRKEFLAPLN